MKFGLDMIEISLVSFDSEESVSNILRVSEKPPLRFLMLGLQLLFFFNINHRKKSSF